MSLFIERLTKPQRDTEIFLAITGVTMTDSEKRFFERKSQKQRSVEILSALKDVNGVALTASEKRFEESKTLPQIDARILEVIQGGLA